jgi:hypothetical protein
VENRTGPTKSAAEGDTARSATHSHSGREKLNAVVKTHMNCGDN